MKLIPKILTLLIVSGIASWYLPLTIVIIIFILLFLFMFRNNLRKNESVSKSLKSLIIPLFVCLIGAISPTIIQKSIKGDTEKIIDILEGTNSLNLTHFQMSIIIDKDKSIDIHSEYPKLSNEAKIQFYFPLETKEKEITSLNNISLNQIPNDYKNKYIKAKLIDKYWELSTDSLLVKEDVVSLFLKPNNVLSKIEGQVKTRFGKELKDAVVKVKGQKVETDDNGRFVIIMPINQRKPQYVITVEKEGYISKELEYVAGDEKEIRLNKIN